MLCRMVGAICCAGTHLLSAASAIRPGCVHVSHPFLQPEMVQHSLERHSTRVATVVSLSGYKQDTRLVGGDEIFVISCTCNASTSHKFAYNNLAIINSPAKQRSGDEA